MKKISIQINVKDLKLRFDKEATAAYLHLKKGRIEYTQQVRKNIIFDFDRHQELIGIEFLFLK